ncbi:MAG: chemotaxis protein CheB, partial [Planctomycetes bacterium]|nr:chemotaxis protein CheB [Planctomycetota bacterium]
SRAGRADPTFGGDAMTSPMREVHRHRRRDGALVAIGASAGGGSALRRIVAELPGGFTLPIVVVQHLAPGGCEALVRSLGSVTRLPVQEARCGQRVERGLYVAPEDYHLLIERNHELSLSVDERVVYCRPSIDVLFESATRSCGPGLIAVLLTGGNSDGANGLAFAQANGATTIVQDPAEAECPVMPRAALDHPRHRRIRGHRVGPLSEIVRIIVDSARRTERTRGGACSLSDPTSLETTEC